MTRVGLTFVVILVVEVVVCGVSAMPAALLLATLAGLVTNPWLRAASLAMAAVPAYVLFALCLMPVSAATTRLTGARTPPDAVSSDKSAPWNPALVAGSFVRTAVSAEDCIPESRVV